MNIEKIDEVFVPPSGERSPHLVSQAGQTFQLLLLPDQDSEVLNYHEVGVTADQEDRLQGLRQDGSRSVRLSVLQHEEEGQDCADERLV